MSLLNLPVELLDGVCQNSTPTDLVALSQSCTRVYPVAQRLLYRHVHVSRAARNLSVVVTLAKRPHIARFVRSFSATLDPQSLPFHSFYRHLATALSGMSEVASLDLFVDSDASWVLKGIHQSAFPRLSHFACSFPFDSNVADFLCKTPALLELEVDSIPASHHFPTATLPHTAIPLLSQFLGSSEAAKKIVPGRPVESIHLSWGDLAHHEVSWLSESTGRIMVLGATTSSLPVPLLDQLAQHLPYLVYLRIMTTYNFAQAPDAAFYEDVAAKLAALPELTAFELSGMHWGSCTKREDGEKRVWQSKPLDVEFNPHIPSEFESDFDFDDPDLFLAY